LERIRQQMQTNHAKAQPRVQEKSKRGIIAVNSIAAHGGTFNRQKRYPEIDTLGRLIRGGTHRNIVRSFYRFSLNLAVVF
jgi:hypothetical protein